MTKNQKIIVRYSEPFKAEVLRSIRNGLTITEARLHYGISGGSTIQQWIRKSGTFGLLSKIIRVEKPNEKDALNELRKQNKRLKEALADAHMDNILSDAFLEVACEKLGMTVEEFKKKAEQLRQKKQ